MERFIEIAQKTQFELKSWLIEELKKTHTDICVGDGFIYAKGSFPVVLTSHMDTVHQEIPSEIVIEEGKNGPIISSPQGIGGDDRCGVYMILEIVKEYNCSVLFFEDEEVGCVGAYKFIKTDVVKELSPNYIIELDRKGSNDAVFYDCDNPEFTDFITKEFFIENCGSCSDISVIAPHIGCAAVNLSCGYYNQHTKSEYVVFSEMEKVIEETKKLLARSDEEIFFEYIEAAPLYGSGYNSSLLYGLYGQGGWYDDDYSLCSRKEKNYTIYYEAIAEDGKLATYLWETVATNSDEALGEFFRHHTYICYEDIVDIREV